MWVTGRSGHWFLPVGQRSWAGPGGPLSVPVLPTRQQPGEGRDDQAERLRRAAILIAPLPTPGPLPVKATRRSFPTTGKHLRGPALTASLRAGCVTAARQAGACRGKRGAIATLKRPTIMPGGPEIPMVLRGLSGAGSRCPLSFRVDGVMVNRTWSASLRSQSSMLRRSAGVAQFRVFRGRAFSSAATASRSAGV